MKSGLKGIILITALSAILTACGSVDSDSSDKNMDNMDHENMDM